MNYIVLVKQVPNIKNIPNEAWDWEKGTLKRGLLENVCNELDKQALAFALGMREKTGGKIVSLTMGPTFAEDVLRYSLSVGADIGILLTDRKLGGADTPATAYPLAQAIRKIERDVFNGDRQYAVVSGMQSVDGDTAQVPPQIAEDLGLVHIAYATLFEFAGHQLQVRRIISRGSEIVAPASFPCVITVAKWTESPNVSFSRTRWAYAQEILRWSAVDINADETRIGLAGSRTMVYKVFSPKEVSTRTCQYVKDMTKLVSLMAEAHARRSVVTQKTGELQSYRVPEGKQPHYSGEVWVYAEQERGEVNAAAFELLGKASELAKPFSEKVGAVLVGKDVRGLADTLIAHGANRVYFSENELLANFLPVPYTRVVADIIERHKPQIMLFGATPLGRELGPRIAYRLRSGLTADCTGLEIVDFQRGKQEFVGVLRQTRPALGGNIMAAIISQNSKVQMSTARPGVFQALVPDTTRTGEIIQHILNIAESDLEGRIISSEVRELTSDITQAVGVTCGGAGCRTKETYERYMTPLAESLGEFLEGKAVVAGSRAAVELGFIDRGHQVGQTGHTVKPRVYIAVGVSGAVQHLTGMQNSDIIVAINKDPKAPIFKAADFGVVASMEEVVPELIMALKARAKSGE